MGNIVFWLTFGLACFGMGFFYSFTPPQIVAPTELVTYDPEIPQQRVKEPGEDRRTPEPTPTETPPAPPTEEVEHMGATGKLFAEFNVAEFAEYDNDNETEEETKALNEAEHFCFKECENLIRETYKQLVLSAGGLSTEGQCACKVTPVSFSGIYAVMPLTNVASFALQFKDLCEAGGDNDGKEQGK